MYKKVYDGISNTHSSRFDVGNQIPTKIFDCTINRLPQDALSVITEVLNADQKDISNIQILKKGMTNRSYVFSCKKKKYIIRIPGEGTDFLVDRQQEYQVYKVIKNKGLCDAPVYINPHNGYKITEFLDNVRVCNCDNYQEVQSCIKKLRVLHDMNLQVDHAFDIFKQIDFYESLWSESQSFYRDYALTKKNIFSLREYICNQPKHWCLTHIDAIPDNFLFFHNDVQLTDWEYAGMQDPHVDIAMFAIYSSYDKRKTDKLIDIYFEGKCDKNTRLKIYCYMAACGLLWSNWCEYKRILGVKFGKYARRQYEYAKEYYNIIVEELKFKGNFTYESR